MKQIFTILLSLLIFQTIDAQSITGKIVDKNNENIEFGTVALYTENDSTLIKGEFTNENGEFNFDNLKEGQYYIIASQIGFEDLKYNFAMNNISLNAGTLILKENTQLLTEVVIKAKKPLIEIQADKTILNTDASLTSGGLNGLELLRKAPGVTVDNNENIQLKGKNGVRIHIDGKPSYLSPQELANLLKGMTSADIEAIEIITNPSAKYDAQGNAGIINLRLRKNKNLGTNGNLNLFAGYGRAHKTNASINLNHRNKKLNIFGNTSMGNSIYKSTQYFDREQLGTVYLQDQNEKSNDRPINAKLGIDYYLNDKHTFGVLSTVNTQYKDNVWQNTSLTNISSSGTRNIIDSVLQATNTIESRSLNNNLNFNYRFADTLGNEVTIDFDKGFYKNRSTSMQPNAYKLSEDGPLLNERNFTNETPTEINIYTAKIDYSKSLKKLKSNIAIGAKYANVNSDNTFLLFNIIDGQAIKDKLMSNIFNYTEEVTAGYVNLNGALSSKFNYQMGLRLENTHSIGDLTREDGVPTTDDDYVDKKYTNLFPSGALTYNINEKNSLNLTYSRRIQRPNYQDLNPFEWRLNELTFRKGNPFLKPQYSDNFEIGYTLLQAANIRLGYSKATDLIVDIIERDFNDENKAFINYRNLAEQEQVSINVSSPLPIKKWWNGYLSITVFQSFFEARFPEYNFNLTSPVTTNLYMEHSFSLPKEMSFEISGWFDSGNVWGAIVNAPQGSLDIGWKKNFWNNNASIKVGFTDLLKTSRWKGESTLTPDLIFKGTSRWESQRLNVNFNYRFGNTNVKSERQRKTGLEDEKNRIKG